MNYLFGHLKEFPQNKIKQKQISYYLNQTLQKKSACSNKLASYSIATTEMATELKEVKKLSEVDDENKRLTKNILKKEKEEKRNKSVYKSEVALLSKNIISLKNKMQIKSAELKKVRLRESYKEKCRTNFEKTY